MLLRKLILAAGCLALAAGSAGCIIQGDPEPPPTGTLTMTWTIDGYDDIHVCYQTGADNLDFVVYDINGDIAAQGLRPCEAFTVSVDLRAGSYDAELTLIDVDAHPVSDTLEFRNLSVDPDSETVVDTDFNNMPAL